MDNTNQTQNAPKAQASATLKTIIEGSNKKLLSLIPQGQSPKLYIDLIKSQIMKPDARGNARPDEDLIMFLYVCKRVGLDPLTRQIYAVYRWDSRQGKEVMSIQAGIDGMRLVAQRSKEYAGQDDIKYVPEDEATKYPTKATCTIYRTINGERVPFSASARWDEYVQLGKDGNASIMWHKMPYTMLGKCAEALALRKGFPNELSGIYSDVEMAQSTNVLADLKAPEKLPDPPKVTVMHGAPPDAPKDIAIGSPEASVQSPPPAPKVDTTDLAQKLAEMRKRIKETQTNKLPIEQTK